MDNKPESCLCNCCSDWESYAEKCEVERNAWKKVAEQRSHLIAKMQSALLEKGVNFDFQKALECK